MNCLKYYNLFGCVTGLVEIAESHLQACVHLKKDTLCTRYKMDMINFLVMFSTATH